MGMRIPRTLYSVMGPIPVERLEAIEHENPAVLVMGRWRAAERVVAVSREVESDVAAFQTTMHEWVHTMLDDSGVSQHLTGEQEEAVCDAVAAVLTAAVRAGVVTIRDARE